MCEDKCPPCEANESQVWENCQCQCKGDDECGVPPSCVVGRKGEMCDEPDCLPCQGEVLISSIYDNYNFIIGFPDQMSNVFPQSSI